MLKITGREKALKKRPLGSDFSVRPSRRALVSKQHQQQNVDEKVATSGEKKRSRKELNEGKESWEEELSLYGVG